MRNPWKEEGRKRLPHRQAGRPRGSAPVTSERGTLLLGVTKQKVRAAWKVRECFCTLPFGSETHRKVALFASERLCLGLGELCVHQSHTAKEGEADGEEPLSSKVTVELQGQSQLGQESRKATDRTVSGCPPRSHTAGQDSLLVSATGWPSRNHIEVTPEGQGELCAQEEGATLVSHPVTCATSKQNTELTSCDPESPPLPAWWWEKTRITHFQG